MAVNVELYACLQISFEVGILTTFGHLEPRFMGYNVHLNIY